MNFVLFEYCNLWQKSWRTSFFGFWLFKFTSYAGDKEKHSSLLCVASAYGQPVFEIFWIKILSFDPDKTDWSEEEKTGE